MVDGLNQVTQEKLEAALQLIDELIDDLRGEGAQEPSKNGQR
jgi:hypothetical protein